jgi:hypothetical protein
MPSGPGAAKFWKEAYAIAKKQGYRTFGEGSPGRVFAKKMAEQLAAKAGKK